MMFEFKCQKCLFLLNKTIRRKLFLQFAAPLSVKCKQWKVTPKDVCENVNLRKIFPNPREKVEQMLAPLVKVYGENAGQRLEFEHTKYAGVWRCKLGLDWPRKFTVTATAADPNDAEECCYLQACSMLQFLGIFNRSGDMLDHKKQLFHFQDFICGSNLTSFRKMSLKLQSKREIINGKKIWTSSIDMVWPLEVHAEAVGATQSEAEKLAAALTSVNLKARKITSGKVLDMFMIRSIMLPEYPSEDMDYSYTLFVDASTKGYGAYLVANDNSAEPAKIPWFVHPWDESRSDLNLKDSAFVEFYGVLGAVYTWKHHFREKKILALCYTCVANRITLHAAHIPRYNNIAADYLSKQKPELFQKLIPMAKKNMKKPKVLHFLGPLQR
ncbi:hypothetical protein LSH36_110g05096 [Paralvinella palmiformis]|uniref:Uncharacterized protein n=1 Tax=Paralvinella palmiformis TaxID=53620 RepID=A0AAD9N988_9ANNE|nr:hypothetical protein LSH36_110g05096 [Paralvinella palmiformis]